MTRRPAFFFLFLSLLPGLYAQSPSLLEVQQALAATRFELAESKLDVLYSEETDKDGLFYSIKGLIAAKRSDFASAENFLKKAVIVGFGGDSAAFNLAELYYEMGKYPEALEQYKSIRNQTWLNDLARFKMMLCYLLTDQKKVARQIVESFNVEDQLPVFHCSQAAWAFANGQVEQGRYYVQAAKDLYVDQGSQFLPLLREQGWIE